MVLLLRSPGCWVLFLRRADFLRGCGCPSDFHSLRWSDPGEPWNDPEDLHRHFMQQVPTSKSLIDILSVLIDSTHVFLLFSSIVLVASIKSELNPS